MRKLALVSTLVLSTVAMTATSAEAQRFRRGGIGPGAAIGLGIAGLAAGAIVAGAARQRYYDGYGYYGRPAYGYYGRPAYGYGYYGRPAYGYYGY